MKKRLSLLLAAALLLTLCGCTAKLTTVRPAEISELRVERIADGELSPFQTTMRAASTLILQLEEPYEETGACTEADGHKYHVTLFLGVENPKVDTEVYLNEDNSVCKDGKRYVPMDKADKPVNIADWDALFVSDDADKPSLPSKDSMRPPEAQPLDSVESGPREVYDHYLAAIDPDVGGTYEGLTIDLDDFLPDSLFYGIGDFGTHKFVCLTDMGNNAVQIEDIVAEPENDAPELRTVYQLDILTHKFAQME